MATTNPPTVAEAVARLREVGPWFGPNAPHLSVLLDELDRLRTAELAEGHANA